MDTILGVVVMFVVAVAGVLVIKKSMDDKFPIIKVDVRYRGTRSIDKFRLRGKSIVQNNVIAILLNNFVYYGDIDYLNYSIQPNGKRIYDAIMRYDYLIGINDYDMHTQKMLDDKPIVMLNKSKIAFLPDGKMQFADGLLMPIKLQTTNDTIIEKEIRTGKDIAVRFIESETSSANYLNASNPVMAVLISCIPMLIMGALFCLMFYVSVMGLSDDVVKMQGFSKEMVEAAARIAGK